VEDTRERLLAAAGSVFADKGFEAATVRDICQQAGANLAAVNYYFGDKERLYIETVKAAHRLRAEQVPLPRWSAEVPPTDKLRGFIETMLTRLVKDPSPPWHVKLMMREVFQPTAACAELVREFFRPHFELLLEILDGLLPANTPEVKRHLVAFSIVGQCLHHRFAAPVVQMLVGEEEYASYTPQRLAEHISRFSIAALEVEPLLSQTE